MMKELDRRLAADDLVCPQCGCPIAFPQTGPLVAELRMDIDLLCAELIDRDEFIDALSVCRAGRWVGDESLRSLAE